MSHSSTQLQMLLEKHKEVFHYDQGCMKKITVKLHVKPGTEPVFLNGTCVSPPNLASRLQPLYKLLPQDKTWDWTASCKEPFKKAKDLLTTSKILSKSSNRHSHFSSLVMSPHMEWGG